MHFSNSFFSNFCLYRVQIKHNYKKRKKKRKWDRKAFCYVSAGTLNKGLLIKLYVSEMKEKKKLEGTKWSN